MVDSSDRLFDCYLLALIDLDPSLRRELLKNRDGVPGASWPGWRRLAKTAGISPDAARPALLKMKRDTGAIVGINDDRGQQVKLIDVYDLPRSPTRSKVATPPRGQRLRPSTAASPPSPGSVQRLADIAKAAGSRAWQERKSSSKKTSRAAAGDDPIEDASQQLPGFSMTVEEGEAEVLLQQLPMVICGKRTKTRGRRTEVEYKIHFDGHQPNQDVWFPDGLVKKWMTGAEDAIRTFEVSAEQERLRIIDEAQPHTQEEMETPADFPTVGQDGANAHPAAENPEAPEQSFAAAPCPQEAGAVPASETPGNCDDGDMEAAAWEENMRRHVEGGVSVAGASSKGPVGNFSAEEELLESHLREDMWGDMVSVQKAKKRRLEDGSGDVEFIVSWDDGYSAHLTCDQLQGNATALMKLLRFLIRTAK